LAVIAAANAESITRKLLTEKGAVEIGAQAFVEEAADDCGFVNVDYFLGSVFGIGNGQAHDGEGRPKPL
jgi:hypothetical protein